MKVAVAIALTAGLPGALASAILKPRIIGPDEPTDRFKSVVSIQNSTNDHVCGGVLVDGITVLTASHCLLNTTDAGFVVAGKTNLEETGGVTVKISTLQRPHHKAFNSEVANTNNSMGDIAIIKLATHIEESDDIGYVPLPKSGAVLDGSEELVAAGWGRNVTWRRGQPTFTVPKLAEVQLELQSLSKCLKPEDAGDASTLICAGKPGKTVCSGDSGGPLIDSKTGTLVGVVSVSIANPQGVACSDAGIFTRVSSYLDFINENLGQRGFTDGDNQRIKDEAKRPALLQSCKERHFNSQKTCILNANDAFTSNRNRNRNRKATEEEWAAYYQDVAKCDAFRDMQSACAGCAEKATADSTDETVIQCSEAVKKGN
ncbi:hypothetical protein G3M48_005154 [Beauveria asiatica]|uniref:Peptidase S1 domain-containing protein n=1 Tax=Beauveria asiatica TaxID=1069075 RepID=A0AAW0RRM6_9HYPO